jgi:hypothetical protein
MEKNSKKCLKIDGSGNGVDIFTKWVRYMKECP